MASVLRPPVEYPDYIPEDMELTRDERRRLRTMSVDDPTSVYHGFPEVQLEMIRDENEGLESHQTLADVVLGSSVEVVERQPETYVEQPNPHKNRRHKRAVPTRSAITVTGPFDRIQH